MATNSNKIRTGRAVASVLVPPVGIYTYATQRKKNPRKAKGYLLASLAGLAIGAGLVYLSKNPCIFQKHLPYNHCENDGDSDNGDNDEDVIPPPNARGFSGLQGHVL